MSENHRIPNESNTSNQTPPTSRGDDIPTTWTAEFINDLMFEGEPPFRCISPHYASILQSRDWDAVDLAVVGELLVLSREMALSWQRDSVRLHLAAASNPLIPRYRRVMHFDRAGALAWDYATRSPRTLYESFDWRLFMRLYYNAGGV